MINESERPIVYFGGGVRSAAGCQPLRDLLEKTGMPATYTPDGPPVSSATVSRTT